MFLVAIFVTGVVFVLAAGKGKPHSWKAVILDTVSNLIGADASRHNDEGWVYNDNERDVTVYATIGDPFRTIFRFVAYHPVQVKFQNIFQSELYDDPDYISCGFPPGDSCLFDFINNSHPWDEQYRKVQFYFFGPYVSSKEEADWELMEIGEEKEMRAWILIEANNLTGDCSECNSENYHSLEMNTHDALLIRDAEDVWRIALNTDFNNPSYPAHTEPPFDFIWSDMDFVREIYCECVEVKPPKGKRPPTYRKEQRYPAWGRGNLAFQIKFTTAKDL